MNILNKLNKLFNSDVNIVEYVDDEIQELKVEIKILEKELEVLIETKNEYIAKIEDFNRQYSLELGDLIEQILKLKQEILYKQAILEESEFKDSKNEFIQIKTKYQEIKQKKIEIENRLDCVDEFDNEYDEIYQEFQEIKIILEEIEFELEKKRQETKNIKNRLKENEIYQDYQQTKDDYEEFHQDYQNQIKIEKNIGIISDEDIKKLKKLFRESVKICHPDLVSDDLKEKAHNIMVELNSAYVRKDIETIERINLNLKDGFEFIQIDDKVNIDVIKQKRDNLIKAIEDEKLEIKEIIQDKVFELLETIDNFDIFFEDMRFELENELKQLQYASNNLEIDNILQDTKDIVEIDLILDKFQIKYIYHMTHIDNLQNILTYGLLSHNNNVAITRIDNKEVNSRRNFIEPINNKNIHNYVPFYFNPKNPMLYVKRDIQENIVILAFDRNLIYSENSIFTDGNASVNGTLFFNNINDLDKLNWECLNANTWYDFTDGKRTKMSEVLVLDKVNIDNLQKIYCNSYKTKQYIENLLIKYPNIQVEINNKIFF